MRAASCIRFLPLAAVACALTGCTTWHWPLSSKWAMDDPDYAEKYSKPYRKDQPARIAKQLVDARHLDGKSGSTFGVGVSGDPVSVSGEIGAFAYPEEWLEAGGGLVGIRPALEREAFVGPELRTRLVLPARVSPFVGVGAYAGVNWFDESAEDDGIDNDDDLFIDEPGEKRTASMDSLAVYPEVGAHLWANGTWRLTGSARYYVNSEGRDADFWYFGLSLGRVSREEVDEDKPDSEPAAFLRLPEVEPAGFEQADDLPNGSDAMISDFSFLDNYLPSN